MWIYTKRRYPNQTKRHLDSFHWRLPSVRCVASAARAEQHAFLPGKKRTCGLTQSMPGMKLKCGDRYPKMCWERILVIHVRGNKYVMEGHGAEGNQFRMFQERPSFSVDYKQSRCMKRCDRSSNGYRIVHAVPFCPRSASSLRSLPIQPVPSQGQPSAPFDWLGKMSSPACPLKWSVLSIRIFDFSLLLKLCVCFVRCRRWVYTCHSVRACVCVCVRVRVCVSEDNLAKSLFSFCHVGPSIWTQAARLAHCAPLPDEPAHSRKVFYLLNI